MLSLTSAKRKLYTWFYKPADTMSFDPMNRIIERSLSNTVSEVLFFYTTAASAAQKPDNILDRLSVVWIWLNKNPDPPEHEFIIFETKDIQDGKTRLFILERVAKKPDSEGSRGTTTKKDSNQPGETLSSMEEGTLTPTSTSTLYPPLLYPTPQHSMGDTISMSSSKSSQAVLNSFNKGEKEEALDQILGEAYILTRRFGMGRNARHIKPNNLKFFELLVLANVVHEFASDYTLLDKNCYWFCNMIFDAIIEIFHLDESISPEDVGREKKYPKIPTNPHNSEISGRYMGMKVNETKGEDLSVIIRDFKKLHTSEVSKVKFFFFQTSIPC